MFLICFFQVKEATKVLNCCAVPNEIVPSRMFISFIREQPCLLLNISENLAYADVLHVTMTSKMT